MVEAKAEAYTLMAHAYGMGQFSFLNQPEACGHAAVFLFLHETVPKPPN